VRGAGDEVDAGRRAVETVEAVEAGLDLGVGLTLLVASSRN
jgi:hypothetical protein